LKQYLEPEHPDLIMCAEQKITIENGIADKVGGSLVLVMRFPYDRTGGFAAPEYSSVNSMFVL